MTPIGGIRNIEENDLLLSDLVADVDFVFVRLTRFIVLLPSLPSSSRLRLILMLRSGKREEKSEWAPSTVSLSICSHWLPDRLQPGVPVLIPKSPHCIVSWAWLPALETYQPSLPGGPVLPRSHVLPSREGNPVLQLLLNGWGLLTDSLNDASGFRALPAPMTPDRWPGLHLPVHYHHHHHIRAVVCALKNQIFKIHNEKQSVHSSLHPILFCVTHITLSCCFSFTSIIYSMLVSLFLPFYFKWRYYVLVFLQRNMWI